MSTDLMEFLRARLDEDEAAARQACEYAEAEWRLGEDGETILWWPPEPKAAEAERRRGLAVTADRWRGQTIRDDGLRIAPHIARHDPARVLREIEAKRRLLRDADDFCAEYDAEIDDDNSAAQRAYCWRDTILRNLAAAYCDHPDYRQEWRT